MLTELKPIIALKILCCLLTMVSIGLIIGIINNSSVWADEIDDVLPFLIQVESNNNPNAISKDNCIGLCQISQIVLKEWNENYQQDMIAISYGYASMDEMIEESNNRAPEPMLFEIVEDEKYLKTIYKKHFKHQLFDRAINVKIGEWYLRRLRDHYLKDFFNNKWFKMCDIAIGQGQQVIKGLQVYTFEEKKLCYILAAYNCGPTYLKKVNYDINKCPKETRNYVRKIMRLYKESK